MKKITKRMIVKHCTMFTDPYTMPRFDGRHAKLPGVNLAGLTLNSAYFHDSNFEGADFSDCDLRSSRFDRADLCGVNFRNANLWWTVFAGADLTGANFQGSQMRGTVFSGADLSDVDFTGVDLQGAVLSGSILPDGMRAGEYLGYRWVVYGDGRFTFGCETHLIVDWLGGLAEALSQRWIGARWKQYSAEIRRILGA